MDHWVSFSNYSASTPPLVENSPAAFACSDSGKIATIPDF
jgi:hypothetical protein